MTPRYGLDRPKITRVPVELSLEYVSTGKDEPPHVYRNFPVEPEGTSDLIIAVSAFDPDRSGLLPQTSNSGRLQVLLAGPADALEELGRYMIALARLQTANPSPNAHFDDVQGGDGSTVHFVVKRI